MPMIAKCASRRSRSWTNGKSMNVVKTPRGGTVSDVMVVLLEDQWRCRPLDDGDRACLARRLHRIASQEAGQKIDSERQDDRVEEKGNDAVAERQATHDAPGDLHVRDLTGHPDDEREIEKVPVVRLFLARKSETACHSRLDSRCAAAPGVAIEDVGVVDREHGVGESPGQQDGQPGEADMLYGEPTRLLLGVVQDKADRQQAGEGRG